MNGSSWRKVLLSGGKRRKMWPLVVPVEVGCIEEWPRERRENSGYEGGGDGRGETAEGGKQRKIKQRKNRVAGKRMRALSAGGNYSDYANSGSVPLLYPAVPQTHCLPAAVCAIFHG